MDGVKTIPDGKETADLERRNSRNWHRHHPGTSKIPVQGGPFFIIN